MTETVSLSYNSNNQSGVFQVNLQENGTTASTQVSISDITGAQETIDAVISAAKSNVGILTQ